MNIATAALLRDRLREADVMSAVLIDDAFDVPIRSELSDAEVLGFWDPIQRDDELLAELKALGILVESEHEFADEDLALLWSASNSSSAITQLANNTVFAAKRSDLEALRTLSTTLQSLGLDVTEVGLSDLDSTPLGDIVFVDYFLGEIDDDDSTTRSSEWANQIYNAVESSAPKPFIVLMSSRPSVSAAAEEFRAGSNLLAGLFDVATKDELTEPTRLALKLAGWTANMPARRTIQQLMDSLESTLEAATQRFIARAKSLSIDDYALLQLLRLQHDGQPLGEYVQWLLAALLVYEVLGNNESFRDSRGSVDKISFDSHPTNHLFPSTQLADLYGEAILEQHVPHDWQHPRQVNSTGSVTASESEEQTTETSTSCANDPKPPFIPLLRLGDLVVNHVQSRAYMVASPDCDLQFAPGDRRQPVGTQPVLLIPGKLDAWGEHRRTPGSHTELLVHESKSYRVLWDNSKMLTVDLGDFVDWCSREGLSRAGRLRSPYALRVQQEALANVGRVGTPVTPPLRDFISGQLVACRADGTTEPIGIAIESAIAVVRGDRDKALFFLSPNVIATLLDSSVEILDFYEEMAATADGYIKSQLNSKIDRWTKCVAEPEKMINLLEKKHELPAKGQIRELIGETLVLHRNDVVGTRCSSKHVVCVLVHYD